MKKKWKVSVIVTAVAALVCLLAAAGAGVWGYVDYLRNGKLIKATGSVPYDHTLYKDHVVLEKYTGGEAEVTVPEMLEDRPVTEIGGWCFERAEQLTRVVLHDKIEVIGKNAFRACSNLKEVTGGKNVRFIGGHSFVDCTNLEKAEVGARLEVIDGGAFERCKKLRSLPAQENLKYINDFAFFESGLEEFEFNRDVRTCGEAFLETPWLRNQGSGFLICGDGDLIAYTGTGKKVFIPEGVKTLTPGCFYKAEGSEIYVPVTVTTIQELTFADCKDIRVYIPDSAVRLGDPERPAGSIILGRSENETICTTEGSCAEQYARDHGLDYEIVEDWLEAGEG